VTAPDERERIQDAAACLGAMSEFLDPASTALVGIGGHPTEIRLQLHKATIDDGAALAQRLGFGTEITDSSTTGEDHHYRWSGVYGGYPVTVAVLIPVEGPL
jgi:hypothetical protein